LRFQALRQPAEFNHSMALFGNPGDQNARLGSQVAIFGNTAINATPASMMTQ
jgi:hypothetical protein